MILKFILNHERYQLAKAILRKKEQNWKFQASWLQTVPQRYSNQNHYGTGSKTDMDWWNKIAHK